MSENSKVQSLKCEFCEDRDSAADAKHGCKQCKAYFCHACLREYHSRGTYRKHDVLAIGDYLSEEGGVCPDHNEAFKLFCESCMESLCCECKFLGRHADHTVVHLQEYATKLKADFHKLLIDVSKQGLEGESKEDIDVTVGVKKILNNVQNSFAERKKPFDIDMQDLIGELGKVWTAINEECDKLSLTTASLSTESSILESIYIRSGVQVASKIGFVPSLNKAEHSFINGTLNSALDNWKKINMDAGSLRKQQQIVSGLKVIKHRMIQSGSDPCTSQSDTYTLSVPLHHCIWHIPKESTEAFEPVCWNSSLSSGSSDLDAKTRLVNVCGMEEYSDISQEELRLDDYILGRVNVKVSVLPRWLSLLKRSTSKSPSTVRVDGLLSTFEPSAMMQSLSKSSFVTTVEQINEASSLLATKPMGTVKCQASLATRLGVSVPTTLTTKSVIKTPGFTAVDGSIISTAPTQVSPATKITTVISPKRGVTSTSPSNPRRDTEYSESEADDSYREPDFALPITLPEKVDVVTGFSFKSTQTKQPTKPEDAAKDLVTKPPNPFANFSFGALKSNPESQQPPAATTSTKQPLFGSIVGSSRPTFASLASSNQPADFSSQSGSSQGFVAGKPLFQSPAAKDSDHIEEFEPELDFKPLVSPPEVTDHKTGEEDETKLFGHHAKLFRHDTETKQWKERGVGEIKILRNETTGRCRILMQREQVLRLCANHTITKDMKLAPLASSDKAWRWFAQDYSEEEMKTEQLAAKFKTHDLARKFKEAFEKCQATLAEQKSEVSSTTAPDPAASVNLKVQQSLAEQFEAKEGEWDCSGCYVRNKPGTEKCVACMTPKDPSPQPPPASVLPPTFQLQPGQQSLADLFAAKEVEWECDVCLVRNKPETVKCVACETPNPSASDQTGVSSTTMSGFAIAPTDGSKQIFGGPFSFGQKPPPSTTTASSSSSFKFRSGPMTSTSTESTDKGFVFGKPAVQSSAFVFKSPSFSIRSSGFGETPTATVSQPVTVTPTTDSGVQVFVFGSQPPTASGFPPFGKPPSSAVASFNPGNSFGSTSFAFTPVKIDTAKTPVKSLLGLKTPQSEFYQNEDDKDAHIYFPPVVSLPDKVEVKTGEEEENCLYTQRAKLYRFRDNEWRERGLGLIKILQHQTTRHIRLLMRREQILKLCLNHLMMPKMELTPMPGAQGKAWCWHAEDFSDEEPSHERFAIKFKTEDIAKEFKKIFDVAKQAGGKSQEDTALEEFFFKGDTSNPTSPVAGFKFKSPATTTSSEMTPAKTWTGKSYLNESSRGSLLENLLVDEKVEEHLSDTDSYSTDEEDEVVFLWEELPTEQKVAKAEQFRLPRCFYLYEKKNPCLGCIGCDPDNFSFSTIGQ